MRAGRSDMNISKSHDDLETEIRVRRLLDMLAGEDPDQTVSASEISAKTDISASAIRAVLSRLALSRLIIPKVVMVCE